MLFICLLLSLKLFCECFVLGAMLGNHHTEMVQSGAIETFCLIKVTDYTVSNPSTGKKIICVTALTVIKTGAEVAVKLGNPVPLKSGPEQGQSKHIHPV